MAPKKAESPLHHIPALFPSTVGIMSVFLGQKAKKPQLEGLYLLFNAIPVLFARELETAWVIFICCSMN